MITSRYLTDGGFYITKTLATYNSTKFPFFKSLSTLTFYCIDIINDCVFPSADVSGVDWMVRHGRSMALAIALKSAPEKLCGKEYCDSVIETVLVNATADRVRG